MAAKRSKLDFEKLVAELIRVLHEEDVLGTSEVVELFVSAGGDEQQALALVGATGDADFDVEEEDYEEDDDEDS